ncbi:O-antigen ligase family protein [Algibacter pectinivorans]|uniref:O-antigen ligase like membrane protein n=1 Tax=Algibacter pectinivorans TaxID=870482 RepID=A0A1I1P5J4_9FLAO|nr:O-antigen ligase family protein [Algibacter pectinivorans]SFD02938.1 O-antigen ligase like membrane protein [Algibacter pectinivorans]
MKNYSYIKLIGLHVVLGVLIYIFKFLSVLYLLGIFVYFTYQIFTIKPSQKVIKVLMACSYIVGAEVFIRMTGGNVLYEASKYLVILFTLIGIVTYNASKQPLPYLVYIFLLIPGILVAGLNATVQSSIRTDIAFNLSGPICLGIVSVFCYKRKISYNNIHKVLLNMALPLIAMTVYLFLYTPDISETLRGTGSNFAASGGFGPNQVSTVLGLGMFLFSIRFFMHSPTLFLKIINGVLLAAVSFRGIVTFSRGGVLTAIFMIVAFIFFYFGKVSSKGKFRISRLVFVFVGLGLGIWLYSSMQTSGLIDNRYTNRDALGREKQDVSTGRSDLISFELDEFFNNPILGVGVGKIKQLREEKVGTLAASHNEMSRILSEHGLFGLAAFCILFFVPLFFRLKNRSNIFFYSCYIFWFLTINHSAMRIAAPAFIYGLCLLDIQIRTKKTDKQKRLKPIKN